MIEKMKSICCRKELEKLVLEENTRGRWGCNDMTLDSETVTGFIIYIKPRLD